MKKIAFLILASVQISRIFAGDSIIKFVFHDKDHAAINDSGVVQILSKGAFLINMRDTFSVNCGDYKMPLSIWFTTLGTDQLYFVARKEINNCNNETYEILFASNRDYYQKRHKKHKRSNGSFCPID